MKLKELLETVQELCSAGFGDFAVNAGWLDETGELFADTVALNLDEDEETLTFLPLEVAETLDMEG